jgi:hypothetical protein
LGNSATFVFNSPGIYKVSLEGVETLGGQTLRSLSETVEIRVVPQAQLALPEITFIDPPSLSSGDTMLIAGKNFGDSQGGSKVIFPNNIAAVAITSWQKNQIILTVPAPLSVGGLKVVTSVGESNEFLIQVNNRAPLLAAISNKTVKANNTLSFTVSASDPDGDRLSYALYVGGDVNHSGALTPQDTLIVNNRINQGVKKGDPAWLDDADLNNDEAITPQDSLITINQINAGKTNLPAGAAINSTSGLFTWKPNSSQANSTYFFAVEASDGKLNDVKTFYVTVQP